MSRRVASLEARLGGALFDRTAAGLTLTGLGQRVLGELEVVEGALTRVDDAASANEHAVEGVVRVALTETLASLFVVPTVLPDLLRRHPKLKIDLVVGNTAADLARREADIAVRFFLMARGDLLTRRVARLQTAVMASRALAKTLGKQPVRDWPFVSVWLPSGPVAEEAWREAAGPGEVRVSTNSFHAQVEAVRAGLGVAVLPVVLGEPLGLASLRLPPGVPGPPAIDMCLVTPRALRKVPRVAVVFEALSASLVRFGS